MSSKRMRIGFIPVVLTILGMAFLGGCTPIDLPTLETFAADFLRSAAAALLL